MEKLSIKEVMVEAWSRYRQHWRKLLPITCIIFGIYMIYELLELTVAEFTGWGNNILIGFGGFVLRLICLYFMFRLEMVLMMTIDGLATNKSMDFQEYYTDTKRIVWRKIGVAIQLLLYTLVPLLLMALGVVFSSETVGGMITKGFFITAGAVIYIWIHSKCFHAGNVVLFDPSVKNVFKESYRLNDGNLKRVMGILVLLIILTRGDSALFYGMKVVLTSSTGRFLSIIVSTIWGVIFVPLGSWSAYITYRSLQKIAGSRHELIEDIAVVDNKIFGLENIRVTSRHR